MSNYGRKVEKSKKSKKCGRYACIEKVENSAILNRKKTVAFTCIILGPIGQSVCRIKYGGILCVWFLIAGETYVDVTKFR